MSKRLRIVEGGCVYRIVAGGTGLIGRHLVNSWLQQNHDIGVIGRSQESILEIFGTQVEAITWNKLTSEKLQSAELIINLAGARVMDRKWDLERKGELKDSRVNTTKKIAELLSTLTPPFPIFFNASAISIYGPHPEAPKNELPPAFDEDYAIDLNSAPDFLTYFCREVERAAEPAILHGVRVVFLRFGAVLTKEGGILPHVMEPFKLFMGGPIGTGYQSFPWVTMDDALRAIDFIIPKSNVAGPINIVAPEGVMQYQLAKVVGKYLNRPAVIPTPAFMLKLMLGERSQLLLEGKHIFPKRLVELGFKFEYPDIDSAIRHLLR